jgi:SAM-dependent methyltransferase
VIWHDVECGGYAADLATWRALADEASGAGVLELGCGTGRVALDLAARGHDVTALDADRELVAALARRARARSLPLRAEVGDARSFALGRSFGLVVLPMQVVQLLGSQAGRLAMLSAARAHLEPGGLLAAALADPFEGLEAEQVLPPLPDIREHAGWIFSSAPVAVRSDGGAVVIDRHRQAVAPGGELNEGFYSVRLDTLGAQELQAEGQSQGFRVRPQIRVPETETYVGSTVVVLEAPG